MLLIVCAVVYFLEIQNYLTKQEKNNKNRRITLNRSTHVLDSLSACVRCCWQKLSNSTSSTLAKIINMKSISFFSFLYCRQIFSPPYFFFGKSQMKLSTQDFYGSLKIQWFYIIYVTKQDGNIGRRLIVIYSSTLEY